MFTYGMRNLCSCSTHTTSWSYRQHCSPKSFQWWLGGNHTESHQKSLLHIFRVMRVSLHAEIPQVWTTSIKLQWNLFTGWFVLERNTWQGLRNAFYCQYNSCPWHLFQDFLHSYAFNVDHRVAINNTTLIHVQKELHHPNITFHCFHILQITRRYPAQHTDGSKCNEILVKKGAFR